MVPEPSPLRAVDDALRDARASRRPLSFTLMARSSRGALGRPSLPIAGPVCLHRSSLRTALDERAPQQGDRGRDLWRRTGPPRSASGCSDPQTRPSVSAPSVVPLSLMVSRSTQPILSQMINLSPMINAGPRPRYTAGRGRQGTPRQGDKGDSEGAEDDPGRACQEGRRLFHNDLPA